MQGKVGQFKSQRANISTNTANGVISVDGEDENEWYFYEEITGNMVCLLKQNLNKRRPDGLRVENSGTSNTHETSEDTIVKLSLLNDSMIKQNSFHDFESVADVRAAGDKTVSVRSMRKSLFPHVAPYVLFHSHDRRERPPKTLRRLLKWKLTSSTPRIVVRILLNSGYRLIDNGDDWSAIWNACLREPWTFRRLETFQKVNSFPGSYHLSDKDQLWRHLNVMRLRHGTKEFDFMPWTYVLPKETEKFLHLWQRLGDRTAWIVKPPSSGRGQGVRVINQWWEIPKWHSAIVQRYISRPKLINGTKFDLRVYVLVTSINPTRIYVYGDGLVRFASVRYVRGTGNLNDRYMHLTNTSVNKQNPSYVTNNGVNSYRGHKWSLKCLWSYLRNKEGVDVPRLWTKIKDIVVKTIVAAESAINAAILGNVASRYTCYELYGFDVLLDENYKPWLLEVNVLPSLQTDSPLDVTIKGALVKNILNMAGYHVPYNHHRQKNYPFTHVYNSLSLREKIKQNEFNSTEDREGYLEGILENLNRDDLRHLIRYEDELTQAGDFERVFPTRESYKYLRFFETKRYYDKLFDAWESRYSGDREKGRELLRRLCEERRHMYN